MEEKDLIRLAEGELLNEAKKAAARYTVAGPSGWQPCPLLKPNKRFLLNTLTQTISSNKFQAKKQEKRTGKKIKEDRKLIQVNLKEQHNYIFNKCRTRKETLKTSQTKEMRYKNKSRIEKKKQEKMPQIDKNAKK